MAVTDVDAAGPLTLCVVEIYRDSVLVRSRDADRGRSLQLWKDGAARTGKNNLTYDAVTLRDDRGTHYKRIYSSGVNANGATELIPGPPAEARMLEVTLGSDTLAIDLLTCSPSLRRPRPVSGCGPYQIIPASADLQDGMHLQAVELYDDTVAIRTVRHVGVGAPRRRPMKLCDDVGTSYRYAEDIGSNYRYGKSFASGRHSVLWFRPSVPQDAACLEIDVEMAHRLAWVSDAGRRAVRRLARSAPRHVTRLDVRVDRRIIASAERDHPWSGADDAD